jgi:hypothetical protein
MINSGRTVTTLAIDAWEDEGGATPVPFTIAPPVMSGTEAQVEWAARIKAQVIADFDRVAASLRATADLQNGDPHADTEATIAILEGKRAEVMNEGNAGYLIREWQETVHQVRQ